MFLEEFLEDGLIRIDTWEPHTDPKTTKINKKNK